MTIVFPRYFCITEETKKKKKNNTKSTGLDFGLRETHYGIPHTQPHSGCALQDFNKDRECVSPLLHSTTVCLLL